MDYSYYINAILNNMGRAPSEIAIKKYGITYEELIHALISTNNIFECSTTLNLPEYSLKYHIRRHLREELPEKQGKSSWRVTLLYSISFAMCPTCDRIFDISELNKFDLARGSYYCSNCISDRGKIYRDGNLDSIKKYRDNYYLQHKPYFNEKAKRYKLDKEQRVPPWADRKKLFEWYENCPNGYHVDHIVPLHGANVSGLHVENNLQYLLAKDNISKSNKFNIDDEI